MGSLLRLRPPNFSEELAWLPGWLQDPHAEPSNQQIKDGQSEFDHVFKNHGSGDYESVSSKDEGRYKSCRLFLSGDSNSPASLAPSSGNVLSLHLHLSHDATSQTFPSQLLDTSQERRIASTRFPCQKTEALSNKRKNENLLVEVDKVGSLKFPHLTSHQETSDVIRRASISKGNSWDINSKENDKYLNDEDVNEAVELSIAASEALTIHDILMSSLSTYSLADASLLEISLRVKQARIGNSDGNSLCPADYTNDIDLLSDVDDLEMEDAFEDVGLCTSRLNKSKVCAPATSHAKDISPPKIRCGYDEKYTLAMNETPEVALDQTRWLNSSAVESPYHSASQFSVVPNTNTSAPTERENFSVQNGTSFQPQECLNSFPPTEGFVNKEGPDELNFVGSDKFESRWLGGWTIKKDPITCPPVEHNNAKVIPEPMVCETSYLSESEEGAPNKNSIIQAQSIASLIASQSSVLFEGLHDRTDESMLLSEDIVRSSSSLVDPLCSVVPCSISSQIACSSLDQNPNDQLNAAEHCNVDLQKTPGLVSEFLLKEQEIVLSSNRKGSPPGRRQFTSLRNYSVHPCCSVVVDRDGMCCTKLPSLLKTTVCEDSSVAVPCVNSLNRCSNSREIGEKYQTSLLQESLANMVNSKEDLNVATEDGITHVSMDKDKKSPIILNRGRHRRLKAFKDLVHDFGREEILQEPMMTTSKIETVQCKKFKTSHSKENVSFHNKAPATKRVRFLESDKQPQQKNFQKMHSSYIDCSTTRSGKKLRRTNPEFKPKAQGLRKHQTNFLYKEIRRPLLHDIEFLLTGFSSQKEKEIDVLIRKYGGTVLLKIPNPLPRRKRSASLRHRLLPVVLCSRKLDTTKFLYGCAVNAFILKVKWLTDSIDRGSILPPHKYMIVRSHVGDMCTGIRRPICQNNKNLIFAGVGMMLHGHHSFFTRFAELVKHGSGQVFKSLQPLVQNLNAGRLSVGVIIAEDESGALRHLKHCASEGRIPTMPASWIINSLHSGKLLPLPEEKNPSCWRTFNILDLPASLALSEEI